jgi:hypothetical protein
MGTSAIAPPVSAAAPYEDQRRAEEEAAWAEVAPPSVAPRIRWTRVLERVHVQVSGPLVLAHMHVGGPGWHVVALQPGTTIEKGLPADKEFRREVWKRILEGEHLSGPWGPMSLAKEDAAHRVHVANGELGS